MNNKGFTLIELLGVIIILALLMIIVFPSIVNSVKNSSNKTDDLTKELIYNAADLFIDQHINNFPKTNGSKYSIELKDLVDEGFLVSPIKLSGSDLDITSVKCIQVTYQNDYTYELKDSGTCKYEINYILPSEYQQVEYIESTGTQYIETNLSGNMYIVGKSQYISMSSIESNILFGQSSGAARWFGTTAGVFKNGEYTYLQNPLEQFDFSVELKFDNLTCANEITINEKKSTRTFLSGYPLSNLSLFNAKNTVDNTWAYFSTARIYEFMVYDDKTMNTLLATFIPCYRKSDNVIGMYDLVNNVFYTNSGTGTFEKGNDV